MSCIYQAQEEAHGLKIQLEETSKSAELAIGQLRIEHSNSIEKIQKQNEVLAVELQDSHLVISKLKERQNEFVELQSAVMDLWLYCSKSPKFCGFREDVNVNSPLAMVTATQVCPNFICKDS